MKRLILTALLILSFTRLGTHSGAFAASGGGAEAGNGGGIAEKNVLYAYLNLGAFMSMCLRTPLCELDARETKLLQSILDQLPKEQAKPGQIIFRSEKISPGSFLIEGQVRIARTGSEVGSPIYMNSDLLYREVAPHDFRAIEVPMAVSILVHELAHHQGAMDHAALDLLGSKMQIFLLRQSQHAESWNGHIALFTFQLNLVTRDEEKRNLKYIDQVVLAYRDELTPLNPAILTSIHCPDSHQKPLGLRIYNLHEERGVHWDSKARLIHKPLQAWYILSCLPGEESDHGNLDITLAFHKASEAGEPDFIPNNTDVRQVSCRADARACK